MGIITSLVRTGIVAGAALAAYKISEKAKASTPADAGTGEKVDAFKSAAKEFYSEVTEVINEKAPGFVDGVSAKAQDLADKAKEKAPGVLEAVADKIQQVADLAREKAPDIADKVAGAAETVSDRARSMADGFYADVIDAVDAEYSPAEADESFAEAVDSEEPKE